MRPHSSPPSERAEFIFGLIGAMMFAVIMISVVAMVVLSSPSSP